MRTRRSGNDCLVICSYPSLGRVGLPGGSRLGAYFLSLRYLSTLRAFSVSGLGVMGGLVFKGLPRGFGLICPRLAIFCSPRKESTASFYYSRDAFGERSAGAFLSECCAGNAKIRGLKFDVSVDYGGGSKCG